MSYGSVSSYGVRLRFVDKTYLRSCIYKNHLYFYMCVGAC